MPILIFDGPEKAGKSTLISQLTGEPNGTRDVEVVDWGPVDSVFDYFVPLSNAIAKSNKGHWVIWDRSWASEYVYNKLTERRENDYAAIRFLEELCDRHGIVRYMVLPPSEVLIRRREEAQDESDLDVDPRRERYHFDRFAFSHNWLIIDIPELEN